MDDISYSKEGIVSQVFSEVSPLTGIIAEEHVVIDFGDHEGKSVLEVSDTEPDFYKYLLQEKEEGNFSIRRAKDKSFRLYVNEIIN
jgi:hypothetical protein